MLQQTDKLMHLGKMLPTAILMMEIAVIMIIYLNAILLTDTTAQPLMKST